VLRGSSFLRLTVVAVTPLRRYGTGNPLVATHLMAALVVLKRIDRGRNPRNL
jgi:hypothetical protein